MSSCQHLSRAIALRRLAGRIRILRRSRTCAQPSTQLSRELLRLIAPLAVLAPRGSRFTSSCLPHSLVDEKRVCSLVQDSSTRDP
jgi:hypothetical protein